MSEPSSNQMREQGALMDAMHPPLPEPYKSQGWVYRDIYAWLTEAEWEELLALFGKDDCKLLAASTRDGKIHGQFWLSPGAVQRSREFIAKLEGAH